MKSDARLQIGKRLRVITLKRKIGVCCEYEHRNYGSMLQALATVMQLEKLGCDYELIRYTRKLTPDLFARSLSRIPEEIHLMIRRRRQAQKLKKYPDIQEGVRLRNARFEQFSRRHFPITFCRYALSALICFLAARSSVFPAFFRFISVSLHSFLDSSRSSIASRRI